MEVKRTIPLLPMQPYHYMQVERTQFHFSSLRSGAVCLLGGFDTVSEPSLSARHYACDQNALLQTSSSLMTFFLAMMCYPEVQRKAQGEIDRVVGAARLPNSNDLDQLPYVQALTWEILRWRVVTPLGRSVCPSHNARLTSERRGAAQGHG